MDSFKITLSIVLSFLLNQNIFGQNVQISNAGFLSEPAIMMNPKNPKILVAGANLNFYFTSNDGGYTWSTETLNSSFGVWGDPAIDVDTSGNFYFTHLANTPNGNWIDRIVCQKSTDDGKTWSDGTFTGLNGKKAQDKQWTVVDRSNNHIYMTWTEFDDYGSVQKSDSSRILFSKSLDQGATWSSPLKINNVSGDCIDKDNTVEGATPAVGPSGEIYVSWAGPNGIVFNRSDDQGETWLSKEILIDTMPGGWDFDIPGLGRANGLPITKCDLSGGQNHGTIYVNWADQRNGINNTDIWLSKSIDGGETWSAPAIVNDDNSNRHQFLTWMDIDQTNGNLFFVFYDRRAHADINTDVYMAISTDGGKSFINRRISETPFTPTEGIFFGDYINISVHNNIVRPIWARHDGVKTSIWTDVSPLDKILATPEIVVTEPSTDVSLFPNPSSKLSYVSFKLHESSTVNLELFNEQQKSLMVLANDLKMDYGKHVIPINAENLNLTSGTYFYQLSINGKMVTLKAMIIE